MTEEFNLSEKELTIKRNCPVCKSAERIITEIYDKKDVKEFIRRLKKEFGEMLINTSYLWKSAEIIDKLAGEKLK
jgi:hypothetical protein